MDVLDRLELTDDRLLGITTNNAASNYSMTHELQSTLEGSEVGWPALMNQIPGMAQVIEVAVGAFMSSFGVIGRTTSWEAHVGDQEVGQNESIVIGNTQRLRKEGNARINWVSATRPGLAKTIDKVRIS